MHHPLVAPDPLHPSANVGRSCFHFDKVQASFAQTFHRLVACEALFAEPAAHAQSPWALLTRVLPGFGRLVER